MDVSNGGSPSHHGCLMLFQYIIQFESIWDDLDWEYPHLRKSPHFRTGQFEDKRLHFKNVGCWGSEWFKLWNPSRKFVVNYSKCKGWEWRAKAELIFRVWFVFVRVRLDLWYSWGNWVAFLTGKLWCHFLEGQRKHRDLPRSTSFHIVPLSAVSCSQQGRTDPLLWYHLSSPPPTILSVHCVKQRRCAAALHGASIIEQRSGRVSPREADAMPECHGMPTPNRRWRWPQGHKVVVTHDLSNRVSDTGRCPWLPADLLRVLPV